MAELVTAEELHRHALVIDAHSDILVDVRNRRRTSHVGRSETQVIRRRHLPRLQEGGIDVLVLAIFVQPHLREGILREALLMVDDLQQEIAESEGEIYSIRVASDLRSDTEDRRLGVLLSLEGTEALAGDLGILRLFYDLGLRSVGLTWFGRTMAADGSGESEAGGGLTGFGRALVRECNRLGILVDVSHLSERGFWDVMSVSQEPVIASHSNARAVHDHPRNLSDDQLRALADSGGCVGLNAYSDFVGPPHSSVSDLLNHALHMEEVMGAGHVGLGLDFVDFLSDLKTTPLVGLAGAQDTGAITQALTMRSVPRATIEDILGQNWLRVWKTVLHQPTPSPSS